MLRHVVLSLAKRSVFARQASNACATPFLIKRATAPSVAAATSKYIAAFHTTSKARDAEEETTAVKAPRNKRATSTDGTKSTTTKKTAAKKATKPKVAKPKAASKPKTPKRVLHPPKLINNPWILYFKERLAAMPKEEKTKTAELSVELVKDFRNLPASERAALDERLAEHKKQFEVELKEYMEGITPEMIAEENKYRRTKRKTGKRTSKYTLLRDPTKPKQPLNGFFRFANEVRSNPQLSEQVLGVSDALSLGFSESAIKIADKWKAMSEAEQEPYQSAYRREKEQYDRDLAEWKSKQTETA